MHHYVTLSCYYHLWNFFLPPPPPTLPLFFISCLSWCCAAGMVVIPYFIKIIPLFPFFAVFTTHLFFTTLQQHATRTPANILQSSQVILSCHPFPLSPYTTFCIHFQKEKKTIFCCCLSTRLEYESGSSMSSHSSISHCYAACLLVPSWIAFWMQNELHHQLHSSSQPVSLAILLTWLKKREKR